MGVPLRQSIKVGTYVARQRLARRDKYPLIVELEPLFACNLECSGCGKIQYPTDILRKRLSVDQAVAAIEECGAPMVSIAGGEPLLHPEIEKMTNALLERKRFVYLCTNALLLERKLDRFTPHPAFSWVIHIDGLKDRHDESVNREGVFDKAVAAIKTAKAKGFRVATNTTFFSTDSPRTVRDVLDFLNDELEVDTMMLSPGYAYEKAPDQVNFLGVNQSTTLFKEAFAGKRKHWRLNHSPLFLDFLEGKVEFECTPWGSPRTPSSVGSGRAICWPTVIRKPTKNSSKPPTGRSTGGAATLVATTAWPTAASSRAPCSPPPAASASRSAHWSTRASAGKGWRRPGRSRASRYW